jgi:Mn-dependent DtxR family transcriptional regulator
MEFSPRQIVALTYVVQHGGCTAKDVAEAIEPGSDSRGAAQTLRTLSRDELVDRSEDATYTATAKGRHAASKF